MNHFEREIEFDEELRGLNNKFMITQDEQKYILNKLNTTIEENKSTKKVRVFDWKYYFASVASILILFILVTPILNSSFTDSIKSNQQSRDSNEMTSATNPSKKDSVVINVLNNAEFEYYHVQLNVSRNGNVVRTQGGMYADGSKIKQGESLTFEFQEEDFSLKGEVILEAIIVDTNETREKFPVKGKILIKLEKGMEYFLEINGDSILSSNLKKVNKY